jgi:hypothetical protein
MRMGNDTWFSRDHRLARDRSFSSRRCALVGVVLGALACGDGGAASAAPGSAPEGTGSPGAAPGVSNSGAAPDSSSAAETPATPGAPAASGEGEGIGSGPIMLGGETPPASDAPSSDAPSSDAPSSDAPSSDAPSSDPPSNADPSTPASAEPANPDPGAAGPSGGPSLVRGAEPTRESATGPGPLQVTVLTTGLRDGPDYGTQTLHVPAGAAPPFAAVAIVPGFNTPESSILPWGPFLASHGIVALTIGTNSPTDSADARARALLDALETLRSENGRAGGPLEGKLDAGHLGVMGWSVGGGGVLIAAASTPTLKAAITLAAFSPGGQFPQDQVPTLFLAGSADPNAGGQSQGIFASLPETTPKMLFEVEGGPHEIGNDPQNAGGEIGRYGLSWLEVFLVGDERYRQFLEERPTQASDFQENLTSAP